jgi:nitronate monooxygenase
MPLPALLENRLRLPVVAAPMFLASGPDLVLACCRAGIVGTFPAKNQRDLDGLDQWLQQISSGLAASTTQTGDQPAPYGVNLIVHPSNKTLEQELDLCAAYRVPIIITSLGAVTQIVDRVHAYGGIVFHDVVNRRHAEKAAAAGVDGLIAVSAGAGGHTGLANPFALIAEIRRFFNGTLLLAGSLGSGSDIAAAQIIGADLAYMGTRFLATRECAADAAYKAMIHESQLADITTTAAVSGITANFLQPSLDRAGISADGPAVTGAINVDADMADAFTTAANQPKPWRDIWSAGHGVGSIDNSPSVADLVQTLQQDYHAAVAAQRGRAAHVPPAD